MGLGSGPELAFIVKGAPVLGVAAMADAPWLLTLVVDKNGPIHAVSDLKGKTISVSTRGSLTDWLVHELSRQQGWGRDGIQTLPVGTDVSQISALKTHQIDGSVVDIGAAYRLEEEGSTRIVVRFGSLFKDFHIHIIYARRAFMFSFRMIGDTRVECRHANTMGKATPSPPAGGLGVRAEP